MKWFPATGEQVDPVRRSDRFLPDWRARAYELPLWAVVLVALFRVLRWLERLCRRHPVAASLVVIAWWIDVAYGSTGMLVVAAIATTILGIWRWRHPSSFVSAVETPARSWWRGMIIRARWTAVVSGAGAVVRYGGRVLQPELVSVTSGRNADRLLIRLASGQSPADLGKALDALAHGLRVHLARLRATRPGYVTLELVRRDRLCRIVTAMPILARTDLKALPIGRKEDGSVWTLRIAGTHIIVAGATGAGKGSILWGLVRALFPAILDGVVQVLAADPKVMELAFGRALFAWYAADAGEIAEMLEGAVAGMQARAAALAGKQRDHTPSREQPFVVVLVDEVAFLTAYHPDKAIRERVKAALATLTTQGRAVGYAVVAALQDPRKEVMSIRNLFPDKIAMRLDEPEQVDMVLGDGARDRGATADLISSDPATGAGVAYVRLEADPDPVRVRAAWVSDADIAAMCRARQQQAPASAIEAGRND